MVFIWFWLTVHADASPLKHPPFNRVHTMSHSPPSPPTIPLFFKDDDGSGCVNEIEFRRGMGEMGLDFPAAAMDELFDSWDPDGSGHLELKELQKQLRRGADITLSADMEAGAAGNITLASKNKVALRTKKVNRRNSTMMGGLDLDESKPVAEQLRDALHQKGLRVIDIFREMDDDQSGFVCKIEFSRSMRQLQLGFSKRSLDELFNVRV